MGKTVTVRYVRIGTVGLTQVNGHATPTGAKAAAEKQIAEKVGKGYREVVAATAVTAKRKGCQQGDHRVQSTVWGGHSSGQSRSACKVAGLRQCKAVIKT